MDGGEKENQDTTDNFTPGLSNSTIQTLDMHTNFKDLLRRPTLILWNKLVNPNTDKSCTAFMIPIKPPCRAMYGNTTTGASGMWAATINQTSASMIMDMFRLFRGSSRYTINVHSSGSTPVYVSLIPHSGVRMMGNHQLTVNGGYPIPGMNFVTEVIIPSVNPSITIEAPYETENTWTVAWDEDPIRNYTWRDKGDDNVGHIAITTQTAVYIDVWWSAGDDFEFANFYGIPKATTSGHRYRLVDAPVVQMDKEDERIPINQIIKQGIRMPDFKVAETVSTLTGLVKNNISMTGPTLTRAFVSTLPLIGTPMVIADAATKTLDMASKTVTNVEKSLSKIDQLAETLSVSSAEITQIIKQAVDGVASKVTGLLQGPILLYDFILDIMIAWMEKSWKVVGVGIVRFISKVLLNDKNPLKIVMDYGRRIGKFLADSLDDDVARVQILPEEPTTVLVGILAGLVGSMTGVVLDLGPRQYASYFSGLTRRLTTSSGVAYLFVVLRYVQAIFHTVRDMFMRALGYIDPQAEALQRLSKDKEFIRKFIHEAQIITSEVNSMLINSPVHRRRYWETVLQAYKIQKILAQAPTNIVSAQLSKLVTDVIAKGNEKFLDLSASPVRFEPMVIYITGEPGIGKSFLTEALVDKLLERTNTRGMSTEKIFYRTAGERFWSGYRNQPVVVYDEWLNTRDPERCIAQLFELMKVKSTAMFIPEMAHLEEKRIHANPLIVLVLTNNAFPTNLGDYVTNSRATLRRREFVMHAERTPEYQNVDYLYATEEQKQEMKEFKHVQFGLYKNVQDAQSLSTIRKNFTTMSAWLAEQWCNYWQRENEKVRVRMQRLPHFAETLEGPLSTRDPFSLFYQIDNAMAEDPTLSQNGWTPMEQLEEALRLTADILQRPIEETVSAPTLSSWELAQEPVVQLDFRGFFSGCLLTGFGIANLVKASAEQLLKWEHEMATYSLPNQECLICAEEKLCIVKCRQAQNAESPHYMCMTCYRMNMDIGTSTCPVCRCPDFIIAEPENHLAVMGLSSWLLYKGVKGLREVSDMLLTFYRARDDIPAVAFILDMCMHNILYLLNPNKDNKSHTAFLQVMSFNNWLKHGSTPIPINPQVFVQSDDWPDLEEGNRLTLAETPSIDHFKAAMNPAIVQEWVRGRKNDLPCIHNRVFEQVVTVSITGEGYDLKWTIRDPGSRTLVNTTAYACEGVHDCPFHHEERYMAMVSNHIRLNSMRYRQMLLNLYQNPSNENFELIPIIVRPTWFKPLEVEISDSWWDYLADWLSNYKVALQYLGAAIAAIAIIIGTYQAAANLMEMGTDVQISATAGSPEAQTRHRNATINRRGQSMSYFQAEEHQMDVFQAVMGKIARNTFKLVIVNTDQKERVMYGTGLFSSVLLIPRHYAIEIQKNVIAGGKLYGHPLNSPQLRAEIGYQADNMIISKDADIAYMMLPTKFPLFKDLRRFIALDSDYNCPLPSTAVLLGNPKTGCEFIREIDVELYGVRYDQIVHDQDNRSFVAKEILVYNYSRAGCCGSLLLRENHQRPILGMHFAGIGEGLSGEGFSIILTQELLGSLAQEKRGVVQFADVHYGPIDEAKFVYNDDVHLMYYGSVSKEETPFTPDKTKLRKSAIWGADGLTANIEPAILSTKDSRYMHQTTPLYEGVKKHGKPTKDFNPKVVDQAGEIYWDLCLSKMKPLIADPKPLTDKEIICGIPGFNHYTGMDMKTSAGYPYCLDKQRTTKKCYVELIRDKNKQVVDIGHVDEKLINIRAKKRKNRKQGIVPHTLFVDTLKDEKRPTQKVQQLGGTRVFCGSPMDYVMDCREYFMHFVAAFMDQRMNLMHAVGINPTSEEWSRLTSKLLQKNSRFCTIDYSNFGAGYNADVAKKGYELMIRWCKENMTLNDDDERIMWCLVYECLQSMHICNNTVYQQGTGSPSGAFFTTIINTIVNILYLLIGWLELIGPDIADQPKLAAPEFYKNVSLFCYGDDGIFSVTEEYVDRYNSKTLHEFFAEYGIVSTGADKTSDIEPTEALTEATFLKRGFKPHPTRYDKWLSPLKEDSIKSATQWIWSSPNIKQSTEVNAEAALLQAHGHGPVYFKEFKNKLNRALLKTKCNPVTANWDELDHKFFTTGFEYNIDDFLDNVRY